MKKLLILLSVGMVISSCINPDDYDFDNIKNATWNPDIGFPLVKSTLTAQNVMGVVDSSVVTTTPDGLIVLQYQSPDITFNAREFISFGGGFSQQLSAVPLIPGTANLEIPLNLNTEGIITGIKLSQGQLKIDFSSGSGLVSVFQFSSIKKPDGSVLTVQVPLNAPATVDLAGHIIEPNGNGGVDMVVTIPNGATGSAVPLFEFSNTEYATIYGDFSPATVKLPADSIQLNIFQNLTTQGRLYLENPTLALDIRNGFGFPIKLDMADFYGYNTETQSQQFVFKSGQGTFVVKAGSRDNPVGTDVTVDNGNSVLADVIEPTPKYLYHAMEVQGDNNGGPHVDSIENGSDITFRTKLRLPLAGRITGLVISDTVVSSLSASFDLVEKVSFKTSIRNGFPFDVKLSMQLLDENYAPILTPTGDPVYLMKDEQIFVGGDPDALGRVDQDNIVPYSSEHALTAEETQVILNAKYIKLSGLIETSGGGAKLIRVYDDYKMQIKAGIKVTGNIAL